MLRLIRHSGLLRWLIKVWQSIEKMNFSVYVMKVTDSLVINEIY